MSPAARPGGADTPPVVTIGMPVYNGERFVREALDSLLAQSFGDFELLVADNASTDGTQAICEDYARRDPRVRYVRHPRNLGAVRNWNFVAEQARGEFFKWASANDICAPRMLEACVRVLRERPDVVLCYGKTLMLDDDGSALGIYEDDPTILESCAVHRFRRAVSELRMNNAQAGLIRTRALRTTGLEPAYESGDMVLMAELALRGGYYRLPDVLLRRRIGKASFSRHLNGAQLAQFMRPGARQQRLPRWRQHFGYVRAALRAPLAVTQKLRALGFVARHLYWDRLRLWHELADAVVRR